LPKSPTKSRTRTALIISENTGTRNPKQAQNEKKDAKFNKVSKMKTTDNRHEKIKATLAKIGYVIVRRDGCLWIVRAK